MSQLVKVTLEFSKLGEVWNFRESTGWVSGVHQVTADLDLVPMLTMKPLKRLRAHRGQPASAWDPQTPESFPSKTVMWANPS